MATAFLLSPPCFANITAATLRPTGEHNCHVRVLQSPVALSSETFLWGLAGSLPRHLDACSACSCTNKAALRLPGSSNSPFSGMAGGEAGLDTGPLFHRHGQRGSMGERWGQKVVCGALQPCQAERFSNQSLGPHHCSPSSSKPPAAGAAPSLPSQSISDAEPAALTSPGMYAVARRVLCTSWHASPSSAAGKGCAMAATRSAAQLSL